MQYHISGCDRLSGADRETVVEAQDEDEALRKANECGILVCDITLIEPDNTELETPVPTNANPPLIPLVLLVAVAIFIRLAILPPFISVFLFGVIIVAFFTWLADASMSPETKDNIRYGNKNSQMICPHCQTKGTVRTKQITQKKEFTEGRLLVPF